MIETYYVVTFNSTHEAMKYDKLFLSQNLKVYIMSLPTEISASCGFALRVELPSIKQVAAQISTPIYYAERKGLACTYSIYKPIP